MRYFNEDEKLKELKVIFEAMESQLNTSPIESEVPDNTEPNSYELRQKKTDSERMRRAANNAASKNSERKVNKFDFNKEELELQDKIRKADNSIQFMTKQMKTEVNEEDRQEYPAIINGLIDIKNVLLTRLKVIGTQASTQSSVASSIGSDDNNDIVDNNG